MDFAHPRSVTRTAADAIAWRETEAARAVAPRSADDLAELTVAEPLHDSELDSLAPFEPERGFTLGVKIAAASVGAAVLTLSLAILQLA